jgi:hypothetical protein
MHFVKSAKLIFPTIRRTNASYLTWSWQSDDNQLGNFAIHQNREWSCMNLLINLRFSLSESDFELLSVKLRRCSTNCIITSIAHLYKNLCNIPARTRRQRRHLKPRGTQWHQLHKPYTHISRNLLSTCTQWPTFTDTLATPPVLPNVFASTQGFHQYLSSHSSCLRRTGCRLKRLRHKACIRTLWSRPHCSPARIHPARPHGLHLTSHPVGAKQAGGDTSRCLQPCAISSIAAAAAALSWHSKSNGVCLGPCLWQTSQPMHNHRSGQWDVSNGENHCTHPSGSLKIMAKTYIPIV